MTNKNIKVSGFDNTKVGTNTITVTYEGNITTFDVDITDSEGNITENPKTGIFNIVIIIFVTIISLIVSYLFYRKYKLKESN